MLLASLNSCVNPWIYIYFNPNLITLFCQFFHRKSNANNTKRTFTSKAICGHKKLHKKLTDDSQDYSNSVDVRRDNTKFIDERTPVRSYPHRLNLLKTMESDSANTCSDSQSVDCSVNRRRLIQSNQILTEPDSIPQYESTITLEKQSTKTRKRRQFSIHLDRMWSKITTNNKRSTSSQIRLYTSTNPNGIVVRNNEQFIV